MGKLTSKEIIERFNSPDDVENLKNFHVMIQTAAHKLQKCGRSNQMFMRINPSLFRWLREKDGGQIIHDPDGIDKYFFCGLEFVIIIDPALEYDNVIVEPVKPLVLDIFWKMNNMDGEKFPKEEKGGAE